MSSRLRDEDYILIGKVVGAHGVRGVLKVLSYTESPDSFKALKAVWLKDKAGGLQELRVESAGVKGKVILLGLSGVDSRTKAESFIDSEVYCPGKWLEELPADEYYWHQIIGLTVRLEDGSVLGKIKAIFPTGSNDVYVVENGSKEYLIPAIEDVVVNIDLTNKIMTIRLLEDLLNMNDI
ncbi:MAG: ribosome maturation factor RimM [Thermodesulfobacteriota bacterium]|nr:ribosome maturation factor RimM [Thermodesulfobacteriota bacterium]